MELMSNLYSLFQLANSNEFEGSEYLSCKSPERSVIDEEPRNSYHSQNVPVKTKCDKATQTECELVVCIVRLKPRATGAGPGPGTPNELIVLDDAPEPAEAGGPAAVTAEDIESAPLILVDGSSGRSEAQARPRQQPARREVPRRLWTAEAKLARDRGEGYSPRGDGVPVKARRLGPVCSCRLRCGERIEPSARQALFDEFWRLGGRVAQWEYLADRVTSAPKLRSTTDRESRRNHSRLYNFRIDGKQPRVCKVFFLNTLGISGAWVVTTDKKLRKHGRITYDARGHNQRKKPAPV